jgi:O-antigen ligase
MLLPVNTKPPRLAWLVAIFVVIIQQGAFVSTPLILREFALRDIQNPFNTAGIAISIVCVGIACFPWIRQIGFLALNNRFSLLYMLIVIVSATWSIHPDLTIRRGIGYLLTILVAAYLSLRFDVIDRMKVLSGSFAISAIGSLVFIAAFPQYGIMQDGDVAGAWRGVFPHKNMLGPEMAVAVFAELFILVACKGRPRWRLALLSTYFALVVLSHSATALLLASAFLAGTCVYLLWQRDRLMGVGISIMVLLLLFAVLIVFWSDPKLAFGILGKDTSLTGRTALWSSVVPLIEQRLVLGWGYRAMWQTNDVSAVVIDQMAEWGAGSSHNAFLEITLQLGLVGAGVILVIIAIALGRGLRCCKAGILPLGWFSLMFFAGAIMAALTMETLGQNQVIEWVVFNVLSFSCGIGLASRRETDPANARRRLVRPMRPVPR